MSEQSVPCPSCSALPGEPCKTLGVPLGGSHRSRLNLFKNIDPIQRIRSALEDTACFRTMNSEQIIFDGHDLKYDMMSPEYGPQLRNHRIGDRDCTKLVCIHCGLSVYIDAPTASES